MTLTATKKTVTEKDRYAVFPYCIEKNQELLPEDVVEQLHDDCHRDDIFKKINHERQLSKKVFVEFLKDFPYTLLHIFVDLKTGKFPGMAWISDIALTDSMLKGTGSFVFFREYWDTKIPLHIGKVTLSQWFHFPWKMILQGIKFDPTDMPLDQGFDLIVGLTPAPNRVAQRFVQQLGMTYEATLPGFTTYDGETVDAMICLLKKEDFRG